MAKLSDLVTILKGVGPTKAKQFANLNIYTLGDLICHFPRGYEDRTRLVPIAKLEPDVPACFKACVMTTPRTSHIRKGLDITKVQVADTTGRLNLTFFNQKFTTGQLQYGKEYIFYGAVSGDFIGYHMTSPVFEPLDAPAVTTRRVLPLYPLTAGLSNAAMLKAVHQALALCDPPAEIIPKAVREQYGILPAERAYYAIHEPSSMAEAELAKKRLVFEEFFVFSAGLALMRASRTEKKTDRYENLDLKPFLNALPFTLTGAQQRAIADILGDFQKGTPMNRLVQGDVGSGKTLVALMTMLLALDNGYQACLMAPTEILAGQHYETLTSMAAQIGVNIKLLTGSTPAAQRRKIHAGLLDGSIHILIGTHAVLEDTVQFHNLGLAVIDEQHRFGVAQRARMWSKNNVPPHILVMTATPIPRTLAMTVYGDLDVSVIDELPPGRKPVTTVLRYDTQRLQVMKALAAQLRQGRQAYIVHPLIHDNPKLELRSVEEGYDIIRETFPQYKVALVHGQLKPDEKDYQMRIFVEGEARIMVATTVIEVGVNVPNASTMIIENAERFGLSQLHQLRGRVGRGADQSYCVLMAPTKLSRDSRQRLELMTQTTDGFVIAEADMRMRGPGDIEGTMQSGIPFDLHIANLATDGQIIQMARNAAEKLLADDPDLSNPANAAFAEELRAVLDRTADWSRIS